jgi:hypothetical protein
MTWLSRLFAFAAAAAALAPANATPYPVQYDFWGIVVNGNSPWAPQNSKFTGYFRFDAATAPTSPGVWNLPTAVFHVQYAGMTLDTMGATAQSPNNHEAITFEAWVPPSELPFPVTYDAFLDMQFETYQDNYFTRLPTTVTPNDHSLFFFVDGNLFAGTDTAFNPSVPEPATAAFFLAGLMGLAWGMRRRSSPNASRRVSHPCAG